MAHKLFEGTNMNSHIKTLALAITLALGGLSANALAATVSNISSLNAGGYTGVSVNGSGGLDLALDEAFQDTAATSGGFVDSISFTLTAAPGEYLSFLNLWQSGFATSGTANSAKTVATSTLIVNGISTSAGGSSLTKSNSGSPQIAAEFSLTGASNPLFTFAPNTSSANITVLTTLIATALGNSATRESAYLRLNTASIAVGTMPVPLPAGVLLLAPGLLALMRRRVTN